MASKAELLSRLMVESQDGNSKSYETLLSEVGLFLDSYLKPKIVDPAQREDVIQEILFALHKSRHTYDSAKSFMSWLLAIAQYKTTDHFRVLYKFNSAEISDDFEDSNQDSLNHLLRQENSHILKTALAELDPRSGEIVTLLKIEELSISEVAKKLKLSESNIKVIAHRAYIKLAQRLRGHYE